MNIVGMPWISVLLIAIVFLGALVEIKTGGLGAGALMSLAAAGVFFGSRYIEGLVSIYPIAIFLGGVLCLVIEMLTPTVGLIAGLGIVAMLMSVVLALGGDMDAVCALFASLLLSVGGFALLVRHLPSSRLWNKVVLRDASSSERGYVSSASKASLVGRTGVAETDLRPSGRGSFDGVSEDVVSDGAFIVKGSVIIVAAVEGSRILVRPVSN